MLQRNSLSRARPTYTHARRSPTLGSNSQSSLWTSPASQPALPRPHAGTPRLPQRYPLVDPAGLLMLAVPGRSGWWALPDSRPTAPTSPPGAAALQPPSSLQGSGARQVAIGCALPCCAGAQNSFHSGNASILKFLPGSSKTAAAGNVAWYGHSLEQTDGGIDRQAEEGGPHEGNIAGQRWRHRDDLPTEQKGQNSSLSPCLLLSFQSLPSHRSTEWADLYKPLIFYGKTKITASVSEADDLPAAGTGALRGGN